MKTISLDELNENEIPLVDNEVNSKIESEHISYLVNQVLDSHRYGEAQTLRLSNRKKEIGKKFYGIGFPEKTLKELNEEYDGPNQRWNKTYVNEIKRKIDNVLIRNKEKFLE